jgi:hypothetical protein
MPKVAFEYRDFWEVPRLIVCTVEGIVLLLDSEFDESLAEYASRYKVYAMPPEMDLDAPSSSEELPASLPEYLGSIPVSSIEFDPSLRKEMEAEPLLELLRRKKPNPL